MGFLQSNCGLSEDLKKESELDKFTKPSGIIDLKNTNKKPLETFMGQVLQK